MPEVSAAIVGAYDDASRPRDDAPDSPGHRESRERSDDYGKSFRVKPKRVRIGLIGWNHVIGLATLQLVF